MYTNNIPLYVQIADKMRENIRTNQWTAGMKIPTEFELCDIFHVSRITIRKAIEELAHENLLVRKKAKGTFVKDNSLEDDTYTLIKSFTTEMKEIGIDIETLKADLSISYANPDIAKFLKIAPGEKIIILKRLRGMKDNGFAYFITYFQFKEYFSLAIKDYMGSFYQYLNQLGIKNSSDKEIVEAILPTKELCQILKIKQYTPILKRSRFTSDIATGFYEYTECFYIGSDYKYYIDFS